MLARHGNWQQCNVRRCTNTASRKKCNEPALPPPHLLHHGLQVNPAAGVAILCGVLIALHQCARHDAAALQVRLHALVRGAQLLNAVGTDHADGGGACGAEGLQQQC